MLDSVSISFVCKNILYAVNTLLSITFQFDNLNVCIRCSCNVHFYYLLSNNKIIFVYNFSTLVM